MAKSWRWAVLAMALTAGAPVLAQPATAPTVPEESGFAALEAGQNVANSKPGPRTVPAKLVPVPATASEALQKAIAAPYRAPAWNANPQSPAEWKALVQKLADAVGANQATIRDKLGLVIQDANIGGVRAFILEPKDMPEAHRNQILLHIHGGGYVYNPGVSGTQEAAVLAGYGKYKVVSIDYRMPPDFPYPAALDDAMAAYKAVLTMADPKHVAVFGSSTGGAMTLALMMRARDEGVALPAAIAPGTPWSDLAANGDTYQTNEWLDNILVSWNGYISHAAALYANGHDWKDPQLSPIYGDFHGLPPAILTSGTRDLFLSNTVRTHRKFRQAGVEAQLQVFEGMSHAQYYLDPYAPESKEAAEEIARFFDAHLDK
ncbi:MAG: alpha/beta hydrolase fold domain-containing protein [Acetobacteraceae bacterium]|nr:alpha/beta hydrolase fold domain-containing protein [Acetobacteraceae bacterium]